MRIVLFGPPGSGKGTQAGMLKDQLGLAHISTGDLLRAAVKAGSPLGLKVRTVMEAGQLVSDDLMLNCSRAFRPGRCRGRFILDGYPRNLAQADALTGCWRASASRWIWHCCWKCRRSCWSSAWQGAPGPGQGRQSRNRACRLQVYEEQTAPVADSTAAGPDGGPGRHRQHRTGARPRWRRSAPPPSPPRTEGLTTFTPRPGLPGAVSHPPRWRLVGRRRPGQESCWARVAAARCGLRLRRRRVPSRAGSGRPVPG